MSLCFCLCLNVSVFVSASLCLCVCVCVCVCICALCLWLCAETIGLWSLVNDQTPNEPLCGRFQANLIKSHWIGIFNCSRNSGNILRGNISIKLIYMIFRIPVLKVDAHGAHVRGTKESWGDQKAGWLNLVAYIAEVPKCRGDQTTQKAARGRKNWSTSNCEEKE